MPVRVKLFFFLEKIRDTIKKDKNLDLSELLFSRLNALSTAGDNGPLQELPPTAYLVDLKD